MAILLSCVFRRQDCHACPTRPLCTQSQQHMRRLRLPPREQYEALAAARTWYGSEEGIERYKQRAGVEGTLSPGVRAFGLRRTRYRGLPKTHMQHVAIATAINIDRIVAWLDERPQATTRTSALRPSLLPTLSIQARQPHKVLASHPATRADQRRLCAF